MATTLTTAVGTVPSTTKVESAVRAVELDLPSSEDLESHTPRTVDELIRIRAQQQRCDDPVVAYPREGAEYIDYTPKDIDALVEKAAAHYSTIIPQRTTSDDPTEVIGILGNSDFSYLITFLAVSRLGHAALLLSTRITQEAYESLLSSTKATTLLVHDAFQSISRDVQSTLPTLRTGLICDPTALSDGLRLKPARLDPTRETNNSSFIIHSSGSTGLPKPIVQTHRASLYAYSQHFNLVGHITLPLYHNHGICCFFRAIYSRKKIYIYNARLPLTSQHLLATLKQHPDIRILYGVPYALKLLSETDEGIRLLARLDIVMFGGSACPKPIGDHLVEKGVNLVGHYGATEVGQLMTSFRDHQNDKGWDWLRVPPHLKPYLGMEERGPNLYELCVHQGWPSKVATNRDDGSYATKDLFEAHPTIPEAWKYYARLDDTLTLENGEKANPLLTEGVIRQNKHVAEAVVFGAGKPRLGAFIIPSQTTALSNSEIVDAVMPAIEDSNKALPGYSKLSRDMIQVLPQDASYRRTDKGTVIRAAFYRDFAEMIEGAYIDKSIGSAVLPREELAELLRKEIFARLPGDDHSQLNDDTDLFAMGVDSLQAIQVRSFILKSLKVDADQLGRNFVFDFPTINQMTDEILRLQKGEPEQVKTSVEERMLAMIEKYAVFEQHQPSDRQADGKYIVITGATGSLGAHAVANLVRQESVRKVYCLVRAPSLAEANKRVQRSLQERRVFHTLSLSERSKVTSLPSDFSTDLLGLGPSTYAEIAGNITHLFHFAWSVNFNKGLESFEKDCVAGVRNLVNLCLKAQRPRPASFNFCSSVSATARTPGEIVPEGLPASFSCAQGMGYAQSKLVAEHLCDRASKATGIDARVLRVGQIIGDTKHGVWNDTEAIPMIFQSAKTIGALPTLDENPAWLPVDTVASTCIEIACSAAESGVFNVVNHRKFHWTEDLLPLLRSAGLEFEAVQQREWIRRLRNSNTDPVANPPIKLLDFFATKYDNDNPRKSQAHATEKAQSHSMSLQNASTINANLMKKIVGDLTKRWTMGENVNQAPVAIVIGGPCGTGKSTLAQSLSESLELPTIEGDDMHSIVSRGKMAQQIPLTDTDRLAWLAHIRGAVMDRISSTKRRAVLVVCSALKSDYRDELRSLQDIAGLRTLFVMLSTDSRQELKTRLQQRKGHYMSADMVDGQVDILQEPAEHEFDTVAVDAAQSKDAVFEEVNAIISEALA